jgi:hypothetical protein
MIRGQVKKIQELSVEHGEQEITDISREILEEL